MVPRSLTVQTALTIMAALVITYFFSLALYSRDKFEALIDVGVQKSAQTISHIVHTVTETEKEDRSKLAASFNSPRLQVKIASTRPVKPSWSNPELGEKFTEQLKRSWHVSEQQKIRVWFSERLPSDIRLLHKDLPVDHFFHAVRTLFDLPAHLTVFASMPLDDGDWLVISLLVTELPHDLWSPSLYAVGLMTLTIVVVSIYVVRRILGQMSTFAEVADRFAKNIDTPLINVDERPRELRDVAKAFATMQTRVSNLIRHRTEMMAAISHDIRTPVTLLRLRTESLPKSAEKQKMLETLDCLEQTLSASLTFAKESANSEGRSAVDLGALLQTLCDDYRESGHNIVCSRPSCDVIVSGQSSALRRGFANLIENGLKFGNRVEITLKAPDLDGQVSVYVRDEGPGIPDAEMERVFEPFYRFDHARSGPSDGAGLGLSISRTVFENHGGRLELSNASQGGLVARVILRT